LRGESAAKTTVHEELMLTVDNWILAHFIEV
jgi:hypothetical protein